jgi:Flp pilus assembly protein TadD
MALGAAFADYPEIALQYLKLAPQDNGAVLLAIGKIHLAAHRWDQARESLQKAVKITPDSPDAWNTLGAVELGFGSPKAAIPHFKRAIELRRDYIPAINNLAGAYAAAGQMDDAIAALRYGLQLAPADESLQQNLEALKARK